MAEAAATGDWSKNTDGSERRIVAESWYIGETLGKGGFGFVKMGYHQKNGKPFALKFIRKADSEDPQAKQQAQLVATEINCLIRIKNPYVLKLFAYRTSCVYPQQDGTKLNTIMLVLELARGGDLFDILYYTKKLELNLARTYFYQMAEGLNAIHEAGICHRDLKPQNLLLNSRFELKITDFGLSKIFEDKTKKKVMKTYYAGTQGYQAPEQILKRNFTPKCDVFSCGVILFILMTGYPPCHNAHYSDPFYKYIAQVNYDKFWLKHRLNKVFDDETRDIMNRTLCYQPTDRMTVKEMLEHPWTQSDQKLSPEKLTETMKDLFKKAMEAKAKDDKKVEKLRGASKFEKHRDIKEFGALPIWEHRVIPKGRAFALKNADGKDDALLAREYLEFLDNMMYEKNGDAAFVPEQLKITLKMTFKKEDEPDYTKDDIAHVNIYKIRDRMVDGAKVRGNVFALFDFPNHFDRHNAEEELYDQYAGGSLPEWMEERLDDDTRDAVHDAVISHLQDNDGKLTDDFKEAVMTNYGTTEAECQQMVDACVATPIEFKLPQMSDWLIPRCFHYLDHTIPLEDAAFSEETPNDYSDMESFFKEFNEADEMGEFFKAAANTERVPTMETHGYTLEEE